MNQPLTNLKKELEESAEALQKVNKLLQGLYKTVNEMEANPSST